MVESLKNTKFKMKYASEKKLIKLGFHWQNDSERYSYRFPIYNRVLFGIINSDEHGYITLDVVDKDGVIYPPFYYYEYGNYDVMLSILNAGFLNKFKKLNIEEKKNKNGKKKINNNSRCRK